MGNEVITELKETLNYQEKRIAKKIRASILCINCEHCSSGELIDDTIAMFDCAIYGLKVIGVFGCNNFEKETRDKITQSQEDKKND